MRHTNPTPCKGKSLIIKLLPLQGALFNIYTQHPGRCPGLCGCWAFSPHWLSFDTLSTKQTVLLPQIAQIYTEAANFRGCTCLRSALPLARTRSAPTEQYRYTPCYVGALETNAPPWRHPNHLCRSVKSVGEYTLQEVLWVLWIPWENIDFVRLVHFLLGWCTWDKCTPLKAP